MHSVSTMGRKAKSAGSKKTRDYPPALATSRSVKATAARRSILQVRMDDSIESILQREKLHSKYPALAASKSVMADVRVCV